MSDGTVLVLVVGTVLVLGVAEVVSGSTCASILAGDTSYVAYVREAQKHVYEEGNDARVGGGAT